MRTSALAVLALLAAALPSRAEEPVQSAAAQRITDARLELMREKLPQVLALPLHIGSQPDVAECPAPYDFYRQELSDFASSVVNPMHRSSDPAKATAEFDAAYPCAARLAYLADKDGFESKMRTKLVLVDSQLARLSAADKRRLVAELSESRISERTAAGALDQARSMVWRLESQDPDAHQLDDWADEVKPGKSAVAFADTWSELHASGFRPPTQVQYRNLDGRIDVPAAAAPAPALPEGISGSIAGYLERWSGPLSPVVVAATCMVESDCRQTVHGQTVKSTYVNSRTGEVGHAYGVMQIIPDTARALAAQLHVSEYQILHDADTNIRAGAAYLESKFEAFHADIGSLDADMAEFVARVRQSFSDDELAAADRGLRGGRRSRTSAMSIVDQVIQTSFASGLGPVVMGWAAYNGQANPDKVAYSRWNRQSHDYVFHVLMSVLRMTPASSAGVEAASIPRVQYRRVDVPAGL